MHLYADPERPGPTELHVTFFTADGTEEAVDVVTVATAGTAVASPRRLSRGHFVATDLMAPDGRWPVEVTAVTAAGDYLFVALDLEVPA